MSNTMQQSTVCTLLLWLIREPRLILAGLVSLTLLLTAGCGDGRRDRRVIVDRHPEADIAVVRVDLPATIQFATVTDSHRAELSEASDLANGVPPLEAVLVVSGQPKREEDRTTRVIVLVSDNGTLSETEGDQRLALIVLCRAADGSLIAVVNDGAALGLIRRFPADVSWQDAKAILEATISTLSTEDALRAEGFA